MSANPPAPRPYPLGAGDRAGIKTPTGRPLSDLTLEALRAGQVGAEDLGIHADTLHEQAAIAEEAGFPHLAANLRRAAELTRIPHEVVLSVYEALRPYRVTHERLLALADELETRYDALENATLIREAAEAYRLSGLL
jgi:propanediol dehydratase small subunit